MALPLSTTDSMSVSNNLNFAASAVSSYNSIISEANIAISAASGPITITIANIPFQVSDSPTLKVIQQEIENQIAPQTAAYQGLINELIAYLTNVASTF